MAEGIKPHMVSTLEELLALPTGTILLEKEDGYRTPDVWRLVQGSFRAVMILGGCESQYALDDQHDIGVILKCGPFTVLRLGEPMEDSK